jgi:hypothetical protein
MNASERAAAENPHSAGDIDIDLGPDTQDQA